MTGKKSWTHLSGVWREAAGELYTPPRAGSAAAKKGTAWLAVGHLAQQLPEDTGTRDDAVCHMLYVP